MYSAEVLSQLCSLNHLSQEIRGLPKESSEASLLQKQIDALRARLPNSILGYHDRFAVRGKPSAVMVNGESCAACHLKLPRALVGELAAPGRFGVCPNCGVFVWIGEKPAAAPAAAATTAEKPVRRAPARAKAKA